MKQQYRSVGRMRRLADAEAASLQRIHDLEHELAKMPAGVDYPTEMVDLSQLVEERHRVDAAAKSLDAWKCEVADHEAKIEGHTKNIEAIQDRIKFLQRQQVQIEKELRQENDHLIEARTHYREATDALYEARIRLGQARLADADRLDEQVANAQRHNEQVRMGRRRDRLFKELGVEMAIRAELIRKLEICRRRMAASHR